MALGAGGTGVAKADEGVASVIVKHRTTSLGENIEQGLMAVLHNGEMSKRIKAEIDMANIQRDLVAFLGENYSAEELGELAKFLNSKAGRSIMEKEKKWNAALYQALNAELLRIGRDKPELFETPNI